MKLFDTFLVRRLAKRDEIWHNGGHWSVAGLPFPQIDIIGAANSEIVTVELLKAYCLPFLLYVLESVSPSKSQLRSLNKCINRAVYKVFGVNDAVCLNDLRCFVGLHDVEELLERRRLKFVDRLISSSISLDLFLANGL